VKSHLGNFLKEGDLCVGFDLDKLNLEELENYPPVILVKKVKEEKKKI